MNDPRQNPIALIRQVQIEERIENIARVLGKDILGPTTTPDIERHINRKEATRAMRMLSPNKALNIATIWMKLARMTQDKKEKHRRKMRAYVYLNRACEIGD